MIWLGIVIILAMAALGAPLFAVLLGAAMLGFYSADIELAIIAIELIELSIHHCWWRCRFLLLAATC